MKLVVTIERAVFDADAAPAKPVNADALAEAIRSELTARIAVDGLPSMLRSSSMLPAVPNRPQAAWDVSAGIGQALYGGLDR